MTPKQFNEYQRQAEVLEEEKKRLNDLKNKNIGITEISDEEIEEMLFHHSNEYAYGFKDAIKWYREQLKSKQ